MTLRQEAQKIMEAALRAALPDTAVRKALEDADLGTGKLILVSVGKVGWQMARTAAEVLGNRITEGVVITKYGHAKGPLEGLHIFEAGHPVPDENSCQATRAATRLVEGLTAEDTVLFLLSGGGSALFEQPLIPLEDLGRLNRELLACGADIVEINTVRKRFSGVKGGRFAQLCAPARVITIVVSDVLGDRLDMIASGPACPDVSTAEEALAVAEKYRLTCTDQMRQLLARETPKHLPNVETHIMGSVRQLCAAAERVCRELDYLPVVLTDRLSCTARDAGVFLGNIAGLYGNTKIPMAFIAGGETVVHLTGQGKGGRNQELALAAAEGISGLSACVFSLGSDGTDGPTDAAGGIVDGETFASLKAQGISVSQVLADNDAYHALAKCNGLLFTGPTGTNVNDLSVLLVRPGR